MLEAHALSGEPAGTFRPRPVVGADDTAGRVIRCAAPRKPCALTRGCPRYIFPCDSEDEISDAESEPVDAAKGVSTRAVPTAIVKLQKAAGARV